jgi:Carboxypeptidase regulatory-like domain
MPHAPLRRCGRLRPLGLLLAVTIGVVLVVAACGVPGSAAGGRTGTLSGRVLLWPTTPVCRPEAPCSAPLPGRHVQIKRADGTVAVTVTTDQQGRFTVALAPGPYEVHVVLGQGLPGMRQTSSGAVTIVAGQMASVTVTVDSGIR